MAEKKKIFLIGLLVLLTLSSYLALDSGEEGILSGLSVLNLPVEEKGWHELYFCPRDNCSKKFTDFLSSADSIKCAFYDLRLEELEELLREKEAEVLVFEENYDGFGTPADSRESMHNKFCVLDKEVVVTGSANPTLNGLRKNNNNLFIIESRYLVENYLAEFREIKNRGRGEWEEERTEHPLIKHNSFYVKNYFCPEDNCEEKVLEELREAEHNITFLTFSFTSNPIGNYLISKKDDVLVRGVFEKRQNKNSKYSEYGKMKKEGMNVVLDRNPHTMHHKVFIIDGETTVFGSYNPSKNGNTRNDENIIIVDSENITSEFVDEYNRIAETVS